MEQRFRPGKNKPKKKKLTLLEEAAVNLVRNICRAEPKQKKNRKGNKNG
jgi:hypothetical protein